MAEEFVSDPEQTEDGLPILKKQNSVTDDGLPILKKKNTGNAVKSTLPQSNIGGASDPNFLNLGNSAPQSYAPVIDPVQKQQLQQQSAHANAIDRAKQKPVAQAPLVPAPKKDTSIFDDISEALYIPAINKGFSDLVIKPAAGATDFIDRTIDKAYQAVTGEQTPDWLRKKGAFHNLSEWVDKGYEERKKPTNIVSETAEGVAGTLPLIASLYTGQGEVNLATKAPKFISDATKLLATTGVLNAFKDATDRGEDMTTSLNSAVKGGAEGALTGLTIDAQMLVGGALGKGVANKLAEKGLLKGGKAAEAILHALSVGTIFGGTAAGEDLLNGRDIDTHNVAKQFGMGLAFEALPVANALGKQVGERIEASDINKKAAQTASLSSAASNLNAESAMRTLMETPVDQLKAINDNIKEGHEDLYANSIERGVKAYDEKNVNEKKALYADQLLLKTQGDVKLIASKIKENPAEFVKAIEESNELEPEQKQDLLEKVQTFVATEVPVAEEVNPVEESPTAGTENIVPTEEVKPIANEQIQPEVNESNPAIPIEQPSNETRVPEADSTPPVAENKGQRVSEADAPTIDEMKRNLPDVGKEGIAIEEPFKKDNRGHFTNEPLDNGTETIVSRDKEGKINGVLEVSYNGKDGVQDKPVAVRVVVDEGSRRQGIATALFKHAQDNGIDVESVRGKETTEAGQALYEANKATKQKAIRQKAIDAISNGVLIPENVKAGETAARFDFGMDAREKSKGMADIAKGDYETAPAKKILEKVMEWEEKGEYPIIEGTGGNTVRRRAATSAEIQENIDSAKKETKPAISKTDKVTEPAEVKAGDPLRQFASKVREGKISKLGGFKTGSLFDTAWDGSLEVVATAIEGGAKLADAIEAGLKHIRQTEWYKGLQEKENFEQQYRSHLEKESRTEPETEATDKATTLRNADVEKKRAEYGFQEPVERKGTTDAEFEAKADAEIKKGYDAHELMDKVLIDKKPITGVESVILAKYQGTKEAELLDINEKIEKATDSSATTFNQLVTDRDRVLDDLQRAYNASEASGTVASDALRARKVRVAQDASLAGFLVRERSQVNKGEKLSQEQIKKVSDEYSDIAKKNAAYQKKIADLQEQLKTANAEKAIKRVQEEVKLESRRTKREVKIEQLDKDIEDTFAALKKIAREKRGMLSANPIPVEYIPEIAKLVKLYTQKGATTLTGIVDNIYHGLKDDIDGLTKEHVLEVIGDLPEAAKKDPLKAVKSRLKSSIRKVEEKTEASDFTPTKRNRVVLDAEALRLRDELEKARYEYELRLHRDAYKNRTGKQKALDAFTEVLNTPRALLASTDFSAPLRQGLVPTASHPILASKALVSMFKSAFSQNHFDRWFYDLREADDYQTIKDSKLYVSDPHKPELAAKEEQFMNNLAEKIPVLGKLVRGSERAYVGYLNKLRVDLFRQSAELYESQGKTVANSPELYKGLAKFINNATGRGDFTNENLAQSLNLALFSPRLIASRLNLLNPVWYAKLPKEVRLKAVGDMAKFIGVGVSILALAKLNGFQVEADPRSADFGKIRSGDKRWDIWGGFSQYVRLFAQELTGQTKSTSTGDINELGGKKFGARTRLDVLAGFFRNKLSPVPAFMANSLAGKDAMGQEFDPVAAIPKSLIPLTLQDTYQAVQKEGIKGMFSTGLPTTFGVGVQTYSDLKPPKEVEAKPDITLNSGIKYKLTEEQLAERKAYNDEWLAKNGEKKKAVFTKVALNNPDLKMEIATKAAKYRAMGQDKEYIEAHRKQTIDNYVAKKLAMEANKYSKIKMLKKYRSSNGKYNLEKSEE